MLRKTIAAALAVVAVVLLSACPKDTNPTPSSENRRGTDVYPPTSGVTPPGNPQSGDTGTNGTNTGGG
ncbi:MAG TPA: hypothetical protein VGO92_12850 [Acidimicrobiales bacterium]|jgi:hypothetical protein|nr:hypothetical protein [Acidimicrobiales bacterium]